MDDRTRQRAMSAEQDFPDEFHGSFFMYPDNQSEALEALRGADTTLAATAEAMLWGIWCRSGDPMIDQLLREGIDAMQQHRLADAEALFARIIAAAPEFAEGWNKRATVRYLRKNFLGSVADCQETLARNPHHFGAASGQGLCHLLLRQFREAAVCFRKALEIHPHLDAARHNLAFAESEGGGSGYLH